MHLFCFFSVLTLLVGQQEGNLACKNVMQRSKKLFPWGPGLVPDE